MRQGKAIIIGGGVGPMAGVGLHAKIIAETQATTDQDHPTIIHISDSNAIDSRADFVLNKSSRNPAHGMLKVTKNAHEYSKNLGFKESVVGVPCNVFHVPKVWNVFMQQFSKELMSDITVIHMLEEVGAYIREVLPNAHRIGLMSVTGTREVGVYPNTLEPKGFSIIQVPEDMHEELNNSIYNTEWGIKAHSNPITDQARNNFLKYVAYLKKQQVDAIILGCSEIPLVLPETEIDGIPLIDPVTALARALVREAMPEKLRPLSSR